MISEKTVELNLTTELINWASKVTRRTYFALAPSQRQEGRLGFDVSVQANGTGVLIQYKRAYVTGSDWEWHLNRTSLRDQHRRLQLIESLGIPVFYAFPFFNRPSEVETGRRQLLLRTFWYRPSRINPPGGPVGHHEVHYNFSTSRFWVTSGREIDLPEPETAEVLMKAFQAEENRANVGRLFEAFNKAMLTDRHNAANGSQTPEQGHEDDLMQGLSAVVQV